MPEILLIDAKWDRLTEYVHVFRQHLLNSALAKHSVTSVIGPAAIHSVVDQHLNVKQFAYITGAGHGLYDTFKGHNDKIIWDVSMDLSRLRGTIVHLFSCRTGKKLGPQILRQGARAFWGYKEDFKIIHIGAAGADMLQDSSAELFIAMDCIIDIGILAGLTAVNVLANVKHYVMQHSGGPHNSLHRATLRRNFSLLVYPPAYGDQNATL